MKKALLVVSALLSLSITGAAFATEQVLVTSDTTKKKPSVMKERIVSETATVTAVDLATRIVTLKGSKGNVFDITADEKVRNLPQVKVGDKVKVQYYESVAIKVMAPGEAPSGTRTTVESGFAKPGEKPGGVLRGQTTVTAKVEAIGKKKKSVTLKGPEGKTFKVKVENPDNLTNVNVGDEVVITLTEAVAISVEGIK